MKTMLLALGLLTAVLTGCRSYPRSSAVLLSPGLDKSIECQEVHERHTADGRLEVVAYIRNLGPRRLEVQVNCVFKDADGFPTEAEDMPFRTLIITENAEEPVTFTSFNDKGKYAVIRVREPR